MPIEPGSTLACLKIQIFLGSSAIQQSFKLYAVRRSKIHQGNEMIVLVPIIRMEVEQGKLEDATPPPTPESTRNSTWGTGKRAAWANALWEPWCLLGIALQKRRTVNHASKTIGAH